MVRAIEKGYPQREIAAAAYRFQRQLERGERVMVGVNKYVMKEGQPINYLRIDESVELEQIERVGRFKASRDAAKVERRLKQLAEACDQGSNVMPVLVDAVKDYVSLGEIADVYRQSVRPVSRADHLLSEPMRSPSAWLYVETASAAVRDVRFATCLTPPSMRGLGRSAREAR